jgi:hypothetical protein
MTPSVRRMHRTFVPGGRRLVTPRWIDHFFERIGPNPFITIKSVAAIRGGKNATNAQFVVTNPTAS